MCTDIKHNMLNLCFPADNSTMVDEVGEERDEDDDTTTVQAPDDEEYNEIYTDEEIIKTKTSLGQAKNVNVFLMAVILLKYI